MLARTNKGDLGAERRADLDENIHSSTSVDLFCEKHDYIFVKYLHEDKYENFKFKLRRGDTVSWRSSVSEDVWKGAPAPAFLRLHTKHTRNTQPHFEVEICVCVHSIANNWT